METQLTDIQQIYYMPRPARIAQYVKARVVSPEIGTETASRTLALYDLKLNRAPQNLPFGRRSSIAVVHTSAGKKVLKLHKKTWPLQTIQYEHSILNRLARLEFSAPRPVAALNGETVVQAGHQRYSLFDYVDGVIFSSCFMLAAQRMKLLELAGHTLAEMHQSLAGFLPEGRHHLGFASYTGERWRNLAWHRHAINSAAETSRSWGRVEDKPHLDWLVSRRHYLTERLEQLEDLLRDAPLPRLVIHGDYGIHNLQFHREGRVTVHDFELARLEWRLIDLVIVLSRTDFERSQHFMAAYLSHLPLSADEWYFLPQVWQLYKLQGAVQSWHTYLKIGGSQRLVAARERVEEAERVAAKEERLLRLTDTLKEYIL